MQKLLWLDDFRNPKDYLTGEYEVIWVKTYEEFCSHLESNGLPDIVCFAITLELKSRALIAHVIW